MKEQSQKHVPELTIENAARLLIYMEKERLQGYCTYDPIIHQILDSKFKAGSPQLAEVYMNVYRAVSEEIREDDEDN